MADRLNRGQQSACLRGINDTIVDLFPGFLSAASIYSFDRVAAEQLALNGVFERVGYDGAVSLCGPGRRRVNRRPSSLDLKAFYGSANRLIQVHGGVVKITGINLPSRI